MNRLAPQMRGLERTFGYRRAKKQEGSVPRARLQGLAGQHDVVAVAEHEDLGGTPDDLFEVHHGAHLEPILPQEQVLKEIPGQAPGPERQVPRADEQAAARLEHAPATLEPGVDVLGIADRFERVDRIEAGIRELQAVEVLD